MVLLIVPLLLVSSVLISVLALWRARQSRGAGGGRPRAFAGRLMAPLLLASALLITVVFVVVDAPGEDDSAGSGKSLPGIYTLHQGHIYMNIGGQGYYRVPGADAGSFGPLGGSDSQNLGKDRSAVYCGSRVIPQLRPEQVRFVSDGYVSDGRRAWYCTRPKQNAAYHWWHDFTYSRSEDSPEKSRPTDYVLVPLESVNAANLKIVVDAYAQDGVRVFYEGSVIPGADGASLQTVKLGQGDLAGRVDDRYARDSRRVYFQGKVVPGAGPATFFAFRPDSDQWDNVYGQDSATGRFYFGATPFPDEVDGVDSRALHLLIADRDRANHELFYNASGIWFWDYRGEGLQRGCANPFAGTPTMLSHGVWADDRNAFVTRAVEEWGNGRSDQSLKARKTQLWMLSGLSAPKWTKVADLSGEQGESRGILWRGGTQLYFAPNAGQNVFLNDALYLVSDPEGLKRDLRSGQYYIKVLQAGDIQRLDSSDGTVVCRAASRYPSTWEFWKQ
jgi:hypothetical protein